MSFDAILNSLRNIAPGGSNGSGGSGSNFNLSPSIKNELGLGGSSLGSLSPIDTSALPGRGDFGAQDPMSLMNRLFGSADGKTSGLVLPGIEAATGIGNAFLGMKQFGLAEDQFDFQKEAFNKNFEVQKNLTNSQLQDRQRARVAANPGAHISPAAYIAEFGVK